MARSFPKQLPPFHTDFLKTIVEVDNTEIDVYFPAIFINEHRLKGGFFKPLTEASRSQFLSDEFSLGKLGQIGAHQLVLFGQRNAPKPLHEQRILGRHIVVNERLKHHLVLWKGRLFVKPLPAYLMDRGFWNRFLNCTADCRIDEHQCFNVSIRKCALGLLYSYIALVQRETDFRIAKELFLLPHDLEWTDWRMFVHELLSDADIDNSIAERFHFAELEIEPGFRFWRTVVSDFLAFFPKNLGWLGAATVFVALVLTAMQLGIATTHLQNNQHFQDASWGFTVFSIIGPIGVVLVVLYIKLIIPGFRTLIPSFRLQLRLDEALQETV